MHPCSFHPTRTAICQVEFYVCFGKLARRIYSEKSPPDFSRCGCFASHPIHATALSSAYNLSSARGFHSRPKRTPVSRLVGQTRCAAGVCYASGHNQIINQIISVFNGIIILIFNLARGYYLLQTTFIIILVSDFIACGIRYLRRDRTKV